MAEDTSFFGSIGNAFSGALGKAKESVSGATAGVGSALGLKAAPAAPAAPVTPVSDPLTTAAGRRRVRKTKKGSSRRRRHSRRKMSRSNK